MAWNAEDSYGTRCGAATVLSGWWNVAHDPSLVARVKGLLLLNIPVKSAARLAGVNPHTVIAWKKEARFAHIQPDPAVREAVLNVLNIGDTGGGD